MLEQLAYGRPKGLAFARICNIECSEEFMGSEASLSGSNSSGLPLASCVASDQRHSCLDHLLGWMDSRSNREVRSAERRAKSKPRLASMARMRFRKLDRSSEPSALIRRAA